jgi:hypothetical protein
MQAGCNTMFPILHSGQYLNAHEAAIPDSQHIAAQQPH